MRTSVFLTGGDNGGWALDDDLAQVRRALDGLSEQIELVQTPGEAQVVHTMWPFALRELPATALSGKRVITHIPIDPAALLGDPYFPFYRARTSLWVAQSKGALKLSMSLGLNPLELVPYAVDTELFSPNLQLSAQLESLRQTIAKHRAAGRVIIGSFQRDSEGGNLTTPKLVKGPDILVEIIENLSRSGTAVTVLLAGPRRHWIRSELSRRNLPFIFFGEETTRDDYGFNNVPRPILAQLYSLIDLYVVSSRSEGGPRAILEAGACGVPLVSTRVGIAPDVLPDTHLFDSLAEGVKKISAVLRGSSERSALDARRLVRDRITEGHTPQMCAPLWRSVYEQIGVHTPIVLPPSALQTRLDTSAATKLPAPLVRAARPIIKALGLERFVRSVRSSSPRLHVSMVYEFHKPPYGGGNQFFLALREALKRLGVRVSENRFASDVDAYLLNSNWFPVERFTDFADRRSLAVVHRIDGPTELVRGNGDHRPDIECFDLNKRFATRTVMQSVWSYVATIARGYAPKNPTIIENGVDPRYFYKRGSAGRSKQGRFRLIASSWSDNLRKGADIYHWMDANLDWSRYSMTFVGRVRGEFKHIEKLPPLDSVRLGALLREHDIYVTASACDPCSNALIEGLSSGLPALFLHDGGHPELTGWGGVGFDAVTEMPAKLEELTTNYAALSRLITAPRIDEIAARYRSVLELAIGETR